MRNRFVLEGQLTDIEFNGEKTRMNIACGNCTDEYCDTTDVCVYAVGDLTKEFSAGMKVRVCGHVVNNAGDICVFLHADKVEPALPEGIKTIIEEQYEKAESKRKYATENIEKYGFPEWRTCPEYSYEAGVAHGIAGIMVRLGIEKV